MRREERTRHPPWVYLCEKKHRNTRSEQWRNLSLPPWKNPIIHARHDKHVNRCYCYIHTRYYIRCGNMRGKIDLPECPQRPITCARGTQHPPKNHVCTLYPAPVPSFIFFAFCLCSSYRSADLCRFFITVEVGPDK